MDPLGVSGLYNKDVMGTSPLALAIAQAEGYGVSQSNIPTLANNPGDLELGDQGNGTLGQGITVYGSASEGWQHLQSLIDSIYNGSSKNYNPNQTLSEFGSIYSGGDPNYGNNLASSLGVSPDTTLADIQNMATSNASSSSGSSLMDKAKALAKGAVGLATGGQVGTAFGAPSLLSERFILAVIGILLIAAGLFAFKQTQVVVSTATNTAKKGLAALG